MNAEVNLPVHSVDRQEAAASSEPATAYVREPSHRLPVRRSCDVAVVGGGLAGIAAALAAARTGVSVCLLEKNCNLGGLATVGRVTVWLPLCDGLGRQVSFGLAEELLRLADRSIVRDDRAAGFVGIPQAWRAAGDPAERVRQRLMVRFNPDAYLLALEKMVLDSGVRLLYDTRVCAAIQTGGSLTHLVLENQDGRTALSCGAAVDASGDANLCALAGEPTRTRTGNVPAGWYYQLRRDGIRLQSLTAPFRKDGEPPVDGSPSFSGTDADQLTDQVIASREMLREHLRRSNLDNPEDPAEPFGIASIPCLRMTRRLNGRFVLSDADRHQSPPDTLGYISDWRQAGPVYPIPLRSLMAVRHRNLLAAGRCFSADETVWDVTRCFPGCAVSGEAAGTSAGLAVRQTGGAVDKLDVDHLRTHLADNGVRIEPELAIPAGEYPERVQIRG